MTGSSGRPSSPPVPAGRRPAETPAGSGAHASPAPGAEAPIDPAVVDSLRRLGQRSGRDVLGELTELFLTTAETQVDAAWDLLGQRNYGQLARVAHSLKGSSSVIGGRCVAAAAAELEELALGCDDGRGDDPARDATRAALDHLVTELERFREAVEDLGRPS